MIKKNGYLLFQILIEAVKTVQKHATQFTNIFSDSIQKIWFIWKTDGYN